MGHSHKNVGALVMIFVLVIGIAECRMFKEEELVDGYGGAGLGAGGGFGGGHGGDIGNVGSGGCNGSCEGGGYPPP
ncbi:hypothetical protein Ahy_A01g001080 isoform B [Arachis hypogaea]|uniref:Glycine-rich protein n=1 Tax=Arachis hypogaea TaxID=3818 RepID=A0A445EME2_ARAHY|nr:hypothetical protein Ahy_A01g001080 isoform B [Arachis hypogaea]